MGLLDNIRSFFNVSKNAQQKQPQVNEDYEKSILADKIVNTVDKIKRINSFDSSIWNLSNISTYELKRRSLNDLQHLSSSLENKLSELTRQSQRSNPYRDSLEKAKWTGQKPKEMSDYDFDRFQRDDDGR